jgi:hypothetical protein
MKITKLQAGGFLTLALIALFCYSTNSALAQTPEEMGIATGVQVSPSRVDWDAEDGQERTGVINLKNFSDNSYNVKVEIEDFYVADDSSEAKFFVPDKNHPLYAYDMINWVNVESKEIDLGPKEGKDIVFKVKVPKGTPTGGYYGVIFFNSKVQDLQVTSEDGQSTAQIGVNQRVGTLLVIAVKGDQPIIRKGQLEKFDPKKKVFLDKPAEFDIVAKNSGNLHYKVLGKFEIDKFGRKIVENELSPRVFYPDKTRQYEQKWDFSSWSYGYYKAKVNLISEDGEIVMNGETSFWVIPWKTTVSIIVLLVIVYLILKIFSTKFEIRKKTEDKNKDDGEGDQNIKDDKKEDEDDSNYSNS